jgi:hypothetical protein
VFEKFMDAAERAAAGASRRQFLGRLGQVALGVAGALGTALVLPGKATAGSPGGCPPRTKPSVCPTGVIFCCPPPHRCRYVSTRDGTTVECV